MMHLGSSFLNTIVAAIASRCSQTFNEREAEVVKVANNVKDSDFLPRFIIIPLDGDRLVTLPISQVTWDSIRRDAAGLYEALESDYEAMVGSLPYHEDIFNIFACEL
jgi:hypothetical protein